MNRPPCQRKNCRRSPSPAPASSATNLSTPTPVAAISRVELDAIGPTLLVDALVQLPQFLNNDTPQTQSFGTSGAAGASYLNLRGIGSVRTLTLLDGRRVVPSTRSGTVDMALLPRSVVRRVEVVTGGASAAYGSDAVSGVVNMLLDADFQRTARRKRRAASRARRQRQGRNSAAAWGSALGERSTLVLSGESSRIEGIRGYNSRDWFESWATIVESRSGRDPREVARRQRARHGLHLWRPDHLGAAGRHAVPCRRRTGAIRAQARSRHRDAPNPAAAAWIRRRTWSGWCRTRRRECPPSRASPRGHPAPAHDSSRKLLAGHSAMPSSKDPPSCGAHGKPRSFRDNAFLPQVSANSMDSCRRELFPAGPHGQTANWAARMRRITGDLLSAHAGRQRQQPGLALDGYYQYRARPHRLHVQDNLRIDRVYRGVDAVSIRPAARRVPLDADFPQRWLRAGEHAGRRVGSAAARAWITEGSAEQLQDVRSRSRK